MHEKERLLSSGGVADIQSVITPSEWKGRHLNEAIAHIKFKIANKYIKKKKKDLQRKDHCFRFSARYSMLYLD